MPQPTKLTPKVQADIVARIKGGLPIVSAARRAGIGERTFYRWMELGDPDNDADAPDLDNLAGPDLRRLAATHNVTVPKRATRQQIARLLADAGVESRALYRQFWHAVKGAEAELEERLVAQWQAASAPILNEKGEIVDRGNPAQLGTILARRFPQHWSPTQAIQLTGKDGGPVDVHVTTEQELARAVKAYLQGVDDTETTNTKEKQP